jgi:hypothetical protein
VRSEAGDRLVQESDAETSVEATEESALRPHSESAGERLLGSLLERAHLLQPGMVASLVTEEVTAFGGRDVTIYVQDYDQRMLQPLTGPGVLPADPIPIDGSLAGRAFSTDEVVEQWLSEDDSTLRLFLPLLDGTDRIGVMALSVPDAGEYDQQLTRRLAALVADMIATKGEYTDAYFNARRTKDMSLAAQLQWQMLPPLTLVTPGVALSGILEPAYAVGGDSFDYALNGHVLSLAIIDAMGHGLDAATMATVAVAAYRRARRAGVGLADLYAQMDQALAGQFGQERFATAQMGELDVRDGVLRWVNAGHPAPLLLRGRRVVRELTGPTTLPVGFGGDGPQARSVQLEPGDRVLFFTDGVIEERLASGEQFGEARLRDLVGRAGAESGSVQETVRRLSHALMAARDGRTTDDATLLLMEWAGPDRDEELP